MKFGKSLPRNQVPEWSTVYIEYKTLKKLIKTLEAEKRAGREPDLAPFFFALDRNIETVDGFFNKRLSEAQRRLKTLRNRYEDHFELDKLDEERPKTPHHHDEEYGEPKKKEPEGYGLDRDEIAEVLGALLELRSGLRKLQWYGEVNRRGFIKILKKVDKKTGSNVQKQYVEGKVLPLNFASGQDVMALMNAVNAWLSKFGNTEEQVKPETVSQDRPVLKRVSSGAAAGLERADVTIIDECIRDDKAEKLEETLERTAKGNALRPRLILNLLQRAITNRALGCVALLLKKVDSLHEDEDINGRNILHRLVISIGRTKGLDASTGTGVDQPAVVDSNHPRLYITPAEAPVSAPPKRKTRESDVLRLPADDESVKLLELILNNMLASQRPALADRDSYGRCPLHYAAQYGFVVVCRLLIKFMREWDMFDVSDGIDSPAWQDNDGYAPLHLAVVGEHPKTTLTLLQSETDDGGVGTTQEIVNARKAVSKTSTVLIMAAKRNSIQIVQLLVEAGVDINYQDDNGETALHHAARAGHVECVKALLKGEESQRCEVELQEKTYGWTPLFIAAVEGKQEVAEVLIDQGHCEVDKLDASGWTPAEHAALRGHVELAKMLIGKAKELGSLKEHDTRESTPPTSVSGSSSPSQPSQPSQTLEKKVSNLSLKSSLEPTSSKTGNQVQATPVKSFGHRYLKQGETLVLITLGSMDTRKNVQAVKLDNIPVSEAHTTQLDTALSLIVSAQNAKGEGSIVDLPVHTNVAADDPIAFETEDASKVTVVFDIVPTYAGSNKRIVGRAVALLGSFMREVGPNRTSLQGATQVPILSINTLEIIGSVSFEFTIVTPFVHPNIGITQEITYWKSMTTPRVIGHRGLGKNFADRKSLQLGENTLLSFIAAAKLGASYVEFDVQLTKDHVPVIYHDFLVGETGIDAPVHTLTLEQFLSMKEDKTHPPSLSRSHSPDDTGSPSNGTGTPALVRRARSMSLQWEDTQSLLDERMKHTRAFKRHGFKGNSRGTSIQAPFATLEQTFKTLPPNVGFNIELKYPMLQEAEEEEMDSTVIEMNAWVDAILKVVYDHIGTGRNIIFSSFNPDICLMLSFKQPSIPILFLTEGGTRPLADIRACSLQEAIRFASRWNLLGIVSAVEPFVLCPRLIKVVKETGLVCVTYGTGNNEPQNVRLQVEQGVDALIVDRVLAVDKEIRAGAGTEEVLARGIVSAEEVREKGEEVVEKVGGQEEKQ